VVIRLGDNLGGFTSTANLTGITNAGQVITGDVNSDGKVDVLV
jgi:hypothetical protein